MPRQQSRDEKWVRIRFGHCRCSRLLETDSKGLEKGVFLGAFGWPCLGLWFPDAVRGITRTKASVACGLFDVRRHLVRVGATERTQSIRREPEG